jgi:excisionase family DNA binding protein
MEPNYTAEFESSRTEPRPLRVNNIARRLGKSERRVRQLAESGKLPAFKIDGKSWGSWPSDVDAYKQLLEARDADRC